MKRLRGKRTLIFNGVAATLAVALAYDWSAFVPPDAMKWVLLGQSIGNIWLRLITTTPALKSEPEQ